MAGRNFSGLLGLAAGACLGAGCGSSSEVPGAVDAGVDAGVDAEAPHGEVEHLISEDFTGAVGTYPAGERVGEWRVLRAEEHAVIAAASELGLSALRGDNVLFFSAFSDAPQFRESRIDRCVPFDAARPMSFRYAVYAAVAEDFVTDDLRVRINPNFYADLDSCEADLDDDSTSSRLEELGTWYNEDFDVRLETAGAEPRAWLDVIAPTHNAPTADMVYAPENYPEGAAAVRFSIRVRDDLFGPGSDRRLYLDAIELTQP
jgi:hypothetical protein